MVKKIALGCGIPLVLIGIIGFFAAKKVMSAPPKVEMSDTVSIGDVEIKVTETGTIEPLRKVEVKSKAGGRVLKLHVDEGAIVQKGQLLASIESQEISSQVEALRAQLAGAQARLAAANKGTDYQRLQTSSGIDQFARAVDSAKARLQASEEEAKRQPEITKQSIEIAEANLDAAKANLKLQQDNLTLMLETTHPQQIVNAEAANERAQAQLKNAERNYARQRQLVDKGFASQQTLDNVQTDVAVAQSNLREAKQRLDRVRQTNELEATNVRSQIASARGQVRQMEAALAQAKSSPLPITRQRDVENARAAFESAKAQLESARSGSTQILVRKDEAISAAATVRQLEGQLKEVLVRQADTTLYATMTGLVTKRYVEEGEIITSAVSSFAAGTAVYQIAEMDVMLVKINVNEVDISKLKPGMPVEVTLDSAKGAIFEGKLRRVSPAALAATAGAAQNVIRFPIEVRIDKPDPRLRPGMSARCTVVVARSKNVTRVPVNCVQGEGEGATVQIVTETKKDGVTTQTTTPRKVKTGLRGDAFVEIVDGVKAGEKIRPNAYKGPERQTINMNGGPR